MVFSVAILIGENIEIPHPAPQTNPFQIETYNVLAIANSYTHLYIIVGENDLGTLSKSSLRKIEAKSPPAENALPLAVRSETLGYELVVLHVYNFSIRVTAISMSILLSLVGLFRMISVRELFSLLKRTF